MPEMQETDEMALDPAHLPTIAALHHAIRDLCPDPLATDHPAFWTALLDRLSYYHQKAFYPSTRSRTPRPAYDTIPFTTRGLHLPAARVARYASGALSWNFASSMPRARESAAYWQSLYYALEAHAFTAHDPYGSHTAIAQQNQTPSTTKTAPPEKIAFWWEKEYINYQARDLGLMPPHFTFAPWYVPGLFPHPDPANPALLRFRARGRALTPASFISAKLGTFLTKHYPNLPAEEIAAQAAAYRTENTPPTLEFARTPEEIATIYRTGPTSCMGGKNLAIFGHNPVTAYATPDLAIAYISRRGKPTARALVRTTEGKKWYSRIYGDSTALTRALRAEGFRAAVEETAEATNDERRTAFYGVTLRALHAPDQRPALKRLDDAAHPVLITPFWDAQGCATYDPATDLLTIGPVPTTGDAATIHKLGGAVSCAAIPRTGPIPYDARSGGIRCHIASSGRLSESYEHPQNLGRTACITAQLAAARPQPPMTPLQAAQMVEQAAAIPNAARAQAAAQQAENQARPSPLNFA